MQGRLILALASLLVAVPAAATVYRWVDADGHIHFSDKPVAANARPLAIRSERTDPARLAAEREAAEAEAAAAAEREAEQAREAENAAISENNRDIRRRNCNNARSRLAQMLGAQRPYRTSPDGERHYLSSEEIDAERAEAKERVDKWCD